MKTLFSDKGVAALEMALIMPVLVILTFGLVEFGVLIYNQQVITNAAREGARRGIVQEIPRVDVATIQDTVHQYADAHLITFSPTKPLPSIPAFTPCGGFGDNLNVTVTYPYTFLMIPFLPMFDGLTLTSTSVMKCE